MTTETKARAPRNSRPLTPAVAAELIESEWCTALDEATEAEDVVLKGVEAAVKKARDLVFARRGARVLALYHRVPEASRESCMKVLVALGTVPACLEMAMASEATETVEALPETNERLDLYVDDLSTIAPSLREPMPPLNAIVKERQ